jgi:hypothetical protein
MSTGFSDCLEIVKLVDEHGDNWAKIFPLYQTNRKKNADALGELSKEGFARYRRYKKADYALVYERFDSLLHNFFPQFFQPPLFFQVAMDPSHTAEYAYKHKKQRHISKFLGFPLIVHAVTSMVALQEAITSRRQKMHQNSNHGNAGEKE